MTVQFTIDGLEVKAQEGEYLIDVARRHGIDIPSLCHHEAVSPIGACRVCLVEVRDGKKSSITTSCNFLVQDGIEVHTNTRQVLKHRALNLELLLARAPKSDVVRAMATTYGVARTRFEPLAYEPLPNCILCELCVRTCDMLGHHALTTIGRGDKKRIGLPFNRPSANCVGCASCASVCPTDCITVNDTPTQRAIWGQKHDFVLCKVCGAPVITEKHRDFAVAEKGLPEDHYDTCERCKQAATSKRFASVVW